MFTLRFLDTLPTSTVDELQSLVAQLRGFLSVSFNEDGTLITANPLLNVVPVGAVEGWLTDTAPAGWLLCDGSQKNRVAYKPLFDVIGTRYGVGDGSTTFNLPDLRGRFFLGKTVAGTGSVLGEIGGTLDHTHTGGTTGSSAVTITGTPAAATATISGSTAGSTAGISGSTANESSHTHGLSTLSDGVTATSTAGGAGVTAGADFNASVAGHAHFSVNPGSGTHFSDAGSAHSHGVGSLSVNSHSHGVGSLTVDSHTHGLGTLAGSAHTHTFGATGTANPPYFAGNWIVFAGV